VTARANQTDSRPVPDPTVLTTQQLQREIATSRELVETSMGGLRGTFEARAGGIDRAIAILQSFVDVLPGQVRAAVAHLQELHEEKFRSIETQFLDRDKRADQTSRDSKVAVDAALQAAKEAVGEQNKSNALAIAKSEATFTKQIDQIILMLGSMQKGTDDKVDDLKSRIQAIESQKKGGSELIGYIVGVGGLAFAIATFVLKH
jgi:cation transport regulator ChaB